MHRVHVNYVFNIEHVYERIYDVTFLQQHNTGCYRVNIIDFIQTVSINAFNILAICEKIHYVTRT